MIKHHVKRGDTLIEVMLAVGIFSMVAVAVVAVMSGGTSSSQTSLETTLAREEIDTQAEALRFIHRAYISDKNIQANSIFGTLWSNIVARAVNSSNATSIDDTITQFHPDNCQSLYDDLKTNNDSLLSKAFVIDTKALAGYEAGSSSLNNVLVTPTRDSNNRFKYATTYPHLVYAKNPSIDPNDTAMSDHSTDFTGNGSLYSVDGIFINAVKDPNSTKVAGNPGTKAAYYDFYIRTCWYGTGDQNPSTISTVIRLYDPDIAIN